MHAFRMAVAFAFVLGLAGCGSDQDVVMPDVMDRSLDVALSDIERAGVEDEVEVLGGGLLGVIDESNWQVCDQSPAAGQVADAPRLTVARSCGDSAPEASETPSEEPAQEPEPVATEPQAEATEPQAEAYSYQGPQYEIVTVDEDQGTAGRNRYWVYTSAFDYSTDEYKDQIRMIVADIARNENTASLIVEVVSDYEIVAAESASTIASFMNEHDVDYFDEVVAPKEESSWAASYWGGSDPDTGEPSDAASAFEIIWRPYATAEIEQWRPEMTG